MEFFHVKLESHDVIYAEGAPAETLLNVEVIRSQFRRVPSPIRNRQQQTRISCAPHIQYFEVGASN